MTGSLRYRFCPDCGEMHDVHSWPANHRLWNEVLAAPNVVRDGMDPVQNQHDGKMYDSKRAMRASYLPSGNKDGVRLIEVGNDPARLKPKQRPKPDRKGIRDSIAKAEARLARGDVTDKTKQILLSRPGPA